MKRTVFILSALISFNVYAECDEAGYFDCGTTGDVKWYLTNDKTKLIFSGQGETATNYAEEVNPYYDGVENKAGRRVNAPWGQYNNTVTDIEVKEGVTGVSWIGLGFEHVTNVSLPSTLEVLGEGALNRTYALQNVDFPDSLKVIGDGALFHTGVTNIIIPDSVKTIDTSGIKYSYAETIIIPDSVTSIADNTFLSSAATIYCTSASPCVGKGSENIVAYEKQGGVYILEDGTKFLSAADMASGTNICNKELNECKRNVLEAKGICQGSSCDTFIQSDGNYMLKFGGKTYQSINDLLKGNYDRRRIYTIEEANFVAGDKNRVSIKYR
ncbi:MAG: leucine-rich repeat domain-containing protein [Alphaproteobacteria bacterium]|nr:leucine-rich repeat domain-containing protein [Alphaproteobacteria bacterium]